MQSTYSSPNGNIAISSNASSNKYNYNTHSIHTIMKEVTTFRRSLLDIHSVPLKVKLLYIASKIMTAKRQKKKNHYHTHQLSWWIEVTHTTKLQLHLSLSAEHKRSKARYTLKGSSVSPLCSNRRTREHLNFQIKRYTWPHMQSQNPVAVTEQTMIELFFLF